jgi:hypothetical protein
MYSENDYQPTYNVLLLTLYKYMYITTQVPNIIFFYKSALIYDYLF